MEELIERISDIIKSPVICNIWQFSNRQKRLIILASLMVLLLLTPLMAQEKDRVSRLHFVQHMYQELFELSPSEEEIKVLGLLDVFTDGGLHLDWPITRGIAANALYRLHLQQGASKKIPRAFADITEASPFYTSINTIGGAFLARNKGRFEPDKLLTSVHLKHAVSVLKIKEIFTAKEPRLYEPDTKPVVQTQSFQIEPIYPSLGFYDTPKSNLEYSQRALSKIENINSMSIATQQLNSQEISDIRKATEAMEEVKHLLEKFGGSIFELTGIETNIPSDDKAIRKALMQFDTLLKDLITRFEYCKLQLSKVTPISPELIKKCDILDSEIREYTQQIKILKKHIMDRLKQPPVVANNEK